MTARLPHIQPLLRPRVRIRRAFCACALILSLSAAAADTPPVLCTPVDDGAPLAADALREVNERDVVLSVGGATRTVPISAARLIEFSAPPPVHAEFARQVWCRSGSTLLAGTFQAADGERLGFSGEGWEATGLGVSDLAALAAAPFLQDAAPHELSRFEDARRHPREDTDTVTAIVENVPQSLRVRVAALTEKGVKVGVEDLRADLSWEKVRWIAFAAAPPSAPEPARRFRVALADGSELVLDSLHWKDGSAGGRWGSAEFRFDTARCVRLEILSGSFRYLAVSDADNVRVTPFLDVAWNPRQDRCVTGGPMTLGGRLVRHGIGAGTRTEMTWPLDRRDERFFARVGVDDAAGPRGSVIFRVLLDGREAFAGPVLRGGAPPVAVSVDVRGARSLTLVSDFGSDLRADGDLADWADARLTRAAE